MLFEQKKISTETLSEYLASVREKFKFDLWKKLAKKPASN